MSRNRKCWIAILIGVIVMTAGEIAGFIVGEDVGSDAFSMLQLPFFIGICIMVPGIVFLGKNKSPIFTSIVVDLAIIFMFVLFTILIPRYC